MTATTEPRWSRAYDALADHAAWEQARRVAAYPAMIEAGAIAPAVASADLAVWAAIVADWRRVTEGLRPPVADVQIWRKRQAIHDTLIRARTRPCADQGAAAIRITLLEALFWHYRRPRPTIWDCLDTTAAIRRELVAPAAEAA